MSAEDLVAIGCLGCEGRRPNGANKRHCGVELIK